MPLDDQHGTSEPAEPVAQVVAEVTEPPAATTGSIDLNAVLAKRRAAGE